MAPTKKFLTQAKIDRAREALDALSECHDYLDRFSLTERCAFTDAKSILKPARKGASR